MSMTREEAIKWLEETIQDTDTYWESCSEALQKELDEQKEVFLLALAALRPVSREQVEKVWRGEWVIGEPDVLGVPIHCSRCGWGSDHADQREWMEYKGHVFCGHCGAPMTDEAVEMVMERMEKLHEDNGCS